MTDPASRVLDRSQHKPAVNEEGPRLRLTSTARAAAMRELAPGETLRIAFAGGCGALGFRLSPVRRAYDGDRLLEVDGVRVLLDARAGDQLDGAVLDHDEEEGFKLEHPSWGLSC